MENRVTFTPCTFNEIEDFIPYKKLQKSKQRALDRKHRKTWGAINPVTRRPKDPKVYDRNKEKRNSRRELRAELYSY